MKKGETGPWAMIAFRVMARLKFLRGAWVDPFRFSDERKLERRLIAEFEADVADLVQRLTPSSHPAAVRIVGSYEAIRGYGHVKEASAAEAAKTRMSTLNELKAGKTPADKAA
jgi:indolepyruvate ferredoxin oxidoreductase